MSWRNRARGQGLIVNHRKREKDPFQMEVWGPEMGYEAGEGATVGTSSVNWFIKLDCGCGGKK